MNISEVMVKMHDFMERNAKGVAAKQVEAGVVPNYKSASHSAAAGKFMVWAFRGDGGNLLQTPENFTVIFHSLANHSAWRQKFEGKGIFPKPTKVGEDTPATAKSMADKVAAKMAKLAEEMGDDEV